MEKEIRESYRITEKDFLQMSILRSRYLTPKENKIILRIVGIIATVGGAAAFINIRGNIYQTICWFLLIGVGLYVFSYYDVTDPFLTYKQAQAFYRYNSESFNSKTVIFTPTLFSINDDSHKLSVPPEYSHSAVEGKNTLIIFIDNEQYYFIPKRVLSEDKLSVIREIIGEEKYKKEV